MFQHCLSLIVFICFSIAQANAQTIIYPYKIKGHLGGVGNGKVYLYFADKNRGLRVDSTLAQDGNFVFSSVVNEPVSAYLVAKSDYYSNGYKKQIPLQLFIENGANINIEGEYASLNKSVVNGGAINTDYQRYLNYVHPVQTEISSVKKQLKNATGDKTESQKELEDLNKKLIEQTTKFVKSNPNDLFSAWLIAHVLAESSTMQVMESCYQSLSDEVKLSSWGKRLSAQIYADKTMVKGAMAPAFVKKGIDGKDVYLSAFRGNYVILNFWSSWCLNCRSANVQINAIQEKYKDKNLQVINISLDKDYDQWVNAVRADKLKGLHINTFFKDKEGQLAVSYNVRSLPMQVLIAPNGSILGRYSELEKMGTKLSALIK